MRDIAITILVFGSLPFILRRPFFGVVMWTWLGLMNPHRLAWGFSTSLPFALIVFVTTVIAYFASKEPRELPVSREVVTLGLFILWMFVTTTVSWAPHLAWAQWDKVWRIQLGILLTLVLTSNRERIKIVVWTISISLGFYAYKGGIWTVLSGGANRVYGPDGTFIGGNNELGLALVMTIPLIWYLVQVTKAVWVKYGLYGAIAFTAVAIVGTHSRGALLGLLVMGMMMLMKSRRKIIPIIGALTFAALLPQIMPPEWFQRMDTIKTYEEDHSATERIRTWGVAREIAASDFFGGGFDVLPVVNGTDAHSIYFEVLAEQGYVGLVMYLALIAMAWTKASRIKKLTKDNAELRWARDLAPMLQTSLVGYMTCGMFLGLAYFDLVYLLIALIVVLYKIVKTELTQARGIVSSPSKHSARALNGFAPARDTAGTISA